MAFGCYVFGTLGNEAAQHTGIVLFSPSTDPKIYDLNDLEWLNGHFTSNFHYYKLALKVLLVRFESIFYLFTVELSLFTCE